MALLAKMYYNDIHKKLTLIGLTGTKGKSSTAYMVKYIMDDYLSAIKKQPCGILSSIDNFDGITQEESRLTTQEAIQLHKYFSNAVNSGLEYMVMEVTSQALKYDRTYGVDFDLGCFMNLGKDHISPVEHTDFDDYFNSKLKMFSQCKTMLLNKSTDKFDIIVETAKNQDVKVILFGMEEDCAIYGYDVKPMNDGIAFKVRTDKFDEEFKISLHGLFNVESALAAVSIAYMLDIPTEYIRSGLLKAQVSGRMEVFTNKTNDVKVVVDYAHNKMSFEALFDSTMKEYPDHKISIVFGCPGKKAYGRRQELGEIAGKYADMCYLTEEDAGEEEVIDICNEIASHIEKEGGKYQIITDRREAIGRSIIEAEKNTVILITGKGRETRMKRGAGYETVPTDIEFAEEFLKEK